jgi:hypothetical protein
LEGSHASKAWFVGCIGRIRDTKESKEGKDVGLSSGIDPLPLFIAHTPAPNLGTVVFGALPRPGDSSRLSDKWDGICLSCGIKKPVQEVPTSADVDAALKDG